MAWRQNQRMLLVHRQLLSLRPMSSRPVGPLPTPVTKEGARAARIATLQSRASAVVCLNPQGPPQDCSKMQSVQTWQAVRSCGCTS